MPQDEQGLTAEELVTEARTRQAQGLPPPGAKVVEKDASGQPTVYEADGERYYTPASVTGQTGFRTETERIKAQQVGAVYGLGEGSLIPEQTIVTTTQKGKPYARYTMEQAEGTAERNIVDIQDYLASGRYNVAVKDSRGRELYLYPDEVQKLHDASGKEQFKVAQDIGLVPKDAKFVGGEDGKWSYIPDYEKGIKERLEAKKKAGVAFKERAEEEEARIVSEAEYKNYETAVSRLKLYMDDKQLVDGARYLKNNPTDRKTLLAAGFTTQDVADWRKYNAEVSSAEKEVERKKPPAEIYKEVSAAMFDSIFVPFIESYEAGKAIGRKEAATGKVLQGDINQEVKKLLLHGADIAVPGVYVGRHWNELSPQEKTLNIAIDVASILIPIGMIKAAGALRAIRATKVVNMAKTAGKAANELNSATRNVGILTKVKTPEKLLGRYADKIGDLQSKSLKADKALFTELAKLDKIPKKQLKIVEKQSGFRGLTKDLTDITKARKQVMKAQNRFDAVTNDLSGTISKRTTGLRPETRMAEQVRIAKDIQGARADLMKAQARLEVTLDKAGSTLQPRYKRVGWEKDIQEYLSPDEIRYFSEGAKWEPPPREAIITDPRIGPKPSPEQSTLDAIKNYLRTAKGAKEKETAYWVLPRREGGVAVAERPVTKARAKVKEPIKETVAEPSTAKPGVKRAPATKEAILEPKEKTPEVTKYGMKPKVKEAFRVATRAIPLTDLGRMTWAEIAEYYQTDEVLDAVSKSVQDQWRELGFAPLSNTRARVLAGDLISEGVSSFADATTKGMTAAKTANLIRESIESVIQREPAPVVAPQPVMKPAIKPMGAPVPAKPLAPVPTKVIKVPIKPIKPLKPAKPPGRIPIPLPAGDKKEKAWTEEEIKSAIAWKDGFVIHALKSPYRRGIDDETFHIDNAPPGLKILDIKGRGSQQATVTTKGKIPGRLTVDVGNQDVIISRGRGRRVTLSHVRDTTGTVSHLTVKKSISKKRGRVFETKAGGGTILSRRPLRGY